MYVSIKSQSKTESCTEKILLGEHIMSTTPIKKISGNNFMGFDPFVLCKSIYKYHYTRYEGECQVKITKETLKQIIKQ